MIWRSVVGKVWLTIILLVAFVLLILTVLLLQFFHEYQVEEAQKDLTQSAAKVVRILDSHEDLEIGRSIAFEVADETTGVIIVGNEERYWMSDKTDFGSFSIEDIMKNNTLSAAMTTERTVSETTWIPNEQEDSEAVMIVGVPATVLNGEQGAVYVYQSLNLIQRTTEETTRIVLLSAGIAIILTTVFAFFLSTRITAPLRKMREAAFQVAKGEFNTKVPILTHDEIGELALAFNRMGRELHFNLTALNQEKEQLTSILSSMVDGVMTINRDGDILVTNPPAKRFLQMLSEEKNQSELPPAVSELFASAVQRERNETTELTVQGRTWVIIMAPLYDGTYVRGAVAVLRDMTDERKLDKLRTDFIANVSHELRTPISLLQGYSEAIVDDVAADEQEMREIGKIIYEESLRMGRLVNELLDMARIEAGYIELSIQNIDLRVYLDRILYKFLTLASEKEVSLRTDLHLSVERFPLDEDRMEQVLTNLLDNAIRHTEAGGDVTMSVQSTTNDLTLRIIDSGHGIPEDDLPFVFERFYKADKARTRGKGGTGLGLAISKNLVEAHGGSLSVHSVEHEGTIFTIVLPFREFDTEQ
ncbi:ATP-binding protein [Aureibacillus halotolerans]|uniref:histidine kinase n=1 Tax=Aureibacillus halotolerans TaxID=1508390 RepID=A0A4R6U9C2_9BACI|nr:ATP-binding protein [Aureibacillus halotolerans]TDQ41573.1 PAS/PAC sensor signal transduction histidine kinase [Aureibacillus halotolerans]